MITFIRPDYRLDRFVRYYWVMRSSGIEEALTFPIGCPQLIFHRLKRFYIPELQSRQARFTVSGQVNFPARIQSAGEVETIVVVFHPHAVAAMFNIPVHAFYNQEIDGYSLGDRSLNILANDVLDADNPTESVRIIERWLLQRLDETAIYNFRRIGMSLNHLFCDNSIGVEGMSQLACLGRKQFERVFFHAVGMMPKEYARIARFQKSLWLMQQGSRNFAGIASECGYADQSHFIRDFRRYSAASPARLVKSQPVYSDLFTSPF